MITTLDHQQKIKVDKRLLIAATGYAEQMNEGIQNALASLNQNVMYDDEKLGMTVYLHDRSYNINNGIQLILCEETDNDNMMFSPEIHIECVETFMSYATEHLMDDWSFAYLPDATVTAQKPLAVMV